MKVFKSFSLFVLLSMFVVLQGHCDSLATDWIESQYTHEGQTFAISFPGIPVEKASLMGSTKRLDLHYDRDGFLGNITVLADSKKERALKFMGEKFAQSMDKDGSQAKMYKKDKMIILEFASENSLNAMIFMEPNMYMFGLRGSLEDIRRLFDSFHVVE